MPPVVPPVDLDASRAVARAAARDAFLAQMDHELRTPLNGVMGMADLLACSGLTPRQRTFVAAIRSSARLLERLIENLLEMAALGAVNLGAVDLTAQPLPLVAEAIVLDVIGPQPLAEDGLKLSLSLVLGEGDQAGGGRAPTPISTLTLALKAPPRADPHPPPHVLIVDDHPVNRRVAAAILQSIGCSTACAEDGAQAVAAVGLSPFDAILMDMRMPVMDGLAATREIRRREAAAQRPRIPIIMVTANVSLADRAAALAAGANLHMSKPVSMAVLIEALNGLLEAAQDAMSGTYPEEKTGT